MAGLLERLNAIASDRQMGGKQDAGLALAALVLIDKNNNIVLDADDMAGTLGRLGWPRYMGVWLNKSDLDIYLSALDVLPRPGDWGIVQSPASSPGIFLDHQGIDITTMVMFIIVEGASFGAYSDWPAYIYTPLGSAVLYPARPPDGWAIHYYFKESRRMTFKGPGGGALTGYYATTPQGSPPGSEMDLFFQEADENHGARYQLEAYSEQAGHIENWTDAYYYSGTREGVYILDAVAAENALGGDYVDSVKVGPPTAPNRFDPAVGFYDA